MGFEFKKISSMEEMKLNFDAPLMSVRRFSSMGSSSAENVPINRRHIFPFHDSASNMDQVTESVAVPFSWEQIPGIAKDWIQAEPQPLEEVVGKASEDRIQGVFIMSPESSAREGRDEMGENGLEDGIDDNDVYSDAPESLSPAESVLLSFNYSVSGLSGSDGLAHKPSGTFSVDPQTRDLMMSRFLPAAKAMALEPTQHTSGNQQQLAIVPYERPKEVKRDPVRDIKMLSYTYDPNIIQKNDEQAMDEEVESEDGNDEIDDDYGIARAKGCGLIPMLCVLNPIPSMKLRTHDSLSEQSRAKNMSKGGFSQAKTALTTENADNCGSDCGTLTQTLGSCKFSAVGSQPTNFSGKLQTMRGSLSPFRRSMTGPLLPQKNFEYKQKSDPCDVTPKLQGPRNNYFVGRYRPFNCSGELQPMRRSLSPYRHSTADALPSQHHVVHKHTLYNTLIPKKSGLEVEHFPGVSRPFNLSGELQPLRGIIVLGCSGSEVDSIMNKGPNFPSEAGEDFMRQASYGVERTVYVDSVNVANISHCDMRTSDQEVWMDPEEQGETSLKRTETEEASSGFKSSECSDSFTGRELILISSKKLKEEQNSDSLPPLLKSPSESWLYRTLPSIPPPSPFNPKKQSPKLSSHETNWETMVKSSNLHHDHVRYSDELVNHEVHKLNL
ncbi:hypothetical protein SAY86_011476 [Trapa natans]|uniref:Uncharacterized protein n=1 Tax=Trapa natans TaxID=22666 RepID=A0AAN7LWH7_TRANT|nr:hypothetical protein SAY86_011476 [Trapa natans]